MLRKFSKRSVGIYSELDFELVKEFIDVEVPFPWPYLQFQCEKCAHVNTKHEVYILVRVEIYQPITEDPEVRKFEEWQGITIDGRFIHIPPDRREEVKKWLPK